MGEFKYDITEVSLGEVSLKKSTCGRPFILSTSTSINYELPHHRIIVLLCRSYSKYHGTQRSACCYVDRTVPSGRVSLFDRYCPSCVCMYVVVL